MRLVLLLCVIASPVWASFGAKTPRTTIAVHGHRGARAMRPENTLPAFSYALGVGVDVLELDLAVTKDNVLVVSHDPHVSFEICETHGGKKDDEPHAIHSLTLAELQRFDCGSKKNPRFPKQEPVKNTHIPTLDDVFDLVKASTAPAAKKVQFNIETKIVPRDVGKLMPDPATFARLVVDAVRRHEMEPRVIVQSFDHRSLVEVRKLAPKIRISALIGEDLPDWDALLKKFRPNFISPPIAWITPEAVKRAHWLKIQVVPWTLNEEADWTYALNCDVDGIISDDPAAVLAWLRFRKRHP